MKNPNQPSMAHIRSVIQNAVSGRTKTAGTAEANMTDSNGEVVTSPDAKQDPETKLQTAVNPQSAQPLQTIDAGVTNVVGKAAPSGPDDPTAVTEKNVADLKTKVAALMRGEPAVTPAAVIAATTSKTAEVQKSSGVTGEDLEKIACVLGDERGQQMLYALLQERHGAAIAEEAIKCAASYMDSVDTAAQAAREQEAVQNALSELAPGEQRRVMKIASVLEQMHAENADMPGAVEAGYHLALNFLNTCTVDKTAAAGPEGEIPMDEASGEIPGEAAPAPASPDNLGEIDAALQELVTSGQISQEEAQQVAQLIMESMSADESAAVDPAAEMQKAASVIEELAIA